MQVLHLQTKTIEDRKDETVTEFPVLCCSCIILCVYIYIMEKCAYWQSSIGAIVA